LKPGKNILLVIEYDGTAYAGWQRQKKEVTIQGSIEKALSQMLNKTLTVHGAGRTDAGVHALGQVAHFHSPASYEPEIYKRALNNLLPNDIVIHRAEEVGKDFHARYSALSKTYRYLILNGSTPSALERNRVWFCPYALDHRVMERCLALVQGSHDFSSFRSQGSETKSPVRNVLEQTLVRGSNGLITITLRADGFLRHMVRAIMGTLVQAGRGKITPSDFQDILKSRDRGRAGPTAPPQGLYLVEVRY